MATTTNYGWTTPDDTALVKDGASAIRTFGTSVDTTTKNLNPETTLGDIAYRSSTSNVNTRLGIGSAGQVLTVAAGVPSWAAAGGALTLAQIATGSLTSGTSLSLTSLSSYDTLVLQIDGFQWATANEIVRLRINNSTSASYNFLSYGIDPAAATTLSSIAATSFAVTPSAATKDNPSGVRTFITLTNCKNAGFTNLDLVACYDRASNERVTSAQGIFIEAAAVSSIQFFTTSSYTFAAGTYTLWGG